MKQCFFIFLIVIATSPKKGSDFMESYRIMILPGKDAKSEFVRNEVASALSGRPKIEIIERENMEAALKQMKIAQLGLMNETKAPKIGQFLAANKFISVSMNGNRVSLKISDVQTAKLEWSKTGEDVSTLSKSLAEFIEHKLFLHNMALMKSKDSDYKITLKSSKLKYKNNEQIQFTVSINKEGNLYLLLLQSNGEIITLFPNDDHPESFVKAGENIVIPEKNSGFIFTAGEPFGTDVVKAIVTKDKLNLFNTKKLDGAPFSQAEATGDDALRGIKRISTSSNSREWNSTEISIDIIE